MVFAWKKKKLCILVLYFSNYFSHDNTSGWSMIMHACWRFISVRVILDKKPMIGQIFFTGSPPWQSVFCALCCSQLMSSWRSTVYGYLYNGTMDPDWLSCQTNWTSTKNFKKFLLQTLTKNGTLTNVNVAQQQAELQLCIHLHCSSLWLSYYASHFFWFSVAIAPNNGSKERKFIQQICQGGGLLQTQMSPQILHLQAFSFVFSAPTDYIFGGLH